MTKEKLIIYCDGGARGNPGPAGIGIVVYDDKGEKLLSSGKYIGETTNNQAEYQAVIFALEQIKKFKARDLTFFLDSELLVNQLNRRYKIKDQDLAKLFLKIWNLTINYPKIIYKHIGREKNKEADAEVNKAIDKHTK